jgi:hypothetical protein
LMAKTSKQGWRWGRRFVRCRKVSGLACPG